MPSTKDYLKDKTILLISPQPWGKMHVSKHHYATALAEKGNKVFFLSPPDYSRKSITIAPIEGIVNLYEIKYCPFFPWKIRFHWKSGFNFLMKRMAKRICSKIGETIDILWNFDPNSFANLTWFKASLNIYHPVDPITQHEQVNIAKSADIVFSVSHKILSAFKDINVPKHFINHGLSPAFVKQAEANLAKQFTPYQGWLLKVGYVGNLLRKVIDRPLFLQIIENNPDLEFHLWGPYELNQSNLSGSDDLETKDFIDKLKSLTNVTFEGVLSPDQLAEEIQSMDLFFLTYQLVNSESDRSNAHKLIEYLSTGKPIISIDIETYKNLGLVEMTNTENDYEIVSIFEQLKNEYTLYYNEGANKKKLNYALNNSIEIHLNSIQAFLEQT